jgi:shikimate kinase
MSALKQLMEADSDPNTIADPDAAVRIRESLGDNNIVLIGLMGAGKTAIGRRLAQRLELPFTDADSEIEIAAGQSISEIFEQHGEPYFRKGEEKVIARLLSGGPQVLATGGGAYMNARTRKNIHQNGIAVWLKGDLNVLMDRVKRRNHRPLLQDGDPEATMKRLIDERYPAYAEADITVQSRDVAHIVIVDEILAALDAARDTLLSAARRKRGKTKRPESK